MQIAATALRTAATARPGAPSAAASATSRALVPVERPSAAPPPRGRIAGDAGLLAQLIAHAEGLAATRARRRADPADAIAAYRAPALRPAPVPVRLSLAV